MLTIRLSKLQEALELLKEVNETKLEDIVWLGIFGSISVSEEEIEEFKYTGLNNVDFARSYKGWVK